MSVGKSLSSDAADPHGLQRFVDAQSGAYDDAVAELRAGRKRSHWIWFVFPQLAALGRSPTAKRFGIDSLAEAQAYLRHDVLGPRLRECARLVAAIEGRSATDLFGYPDDLKVRSSMTLFARAAGDSAAGADFRAVLEALYDSAEDPLTVEFLAR